MQLGAYGWILFGVDTDRNAYTGGGRGDELLVLASGEGTTYARWNGSRFTSGFPHHDLGAALSVTDLTFVLSVADLGTSSFEFSVASLREDADLAPGRGVAGYPLPPRQSRRPPNRPRRLRFQEPRPATTPHQLPRLQLRIRSPAASAPTATIAQLTSSVVFRPLT
jgi:hypothetical protein